MGMELRCGSSLIPPAALRQVFFNDPWGNMIEMIVY